MFGGWSRAVSFALENTPRTAHKLFIINGSGIIGDD
jgi:hypothetical protein